LTGWNYEARQDRVLRAILPLSVCIVGLLVCARPSDAIDFYEIEIYDMDTTPAGHLQLELYSKMTSTATGQLAKSQMFWETNIFSFHTLGGISPIGTSGESCSLPTVPFKPA